MQQNFETIYRGRLAESILTILSGKSLNQLCVDKIYESYTIGSKHSLGFLHCFRASREKPRERTFLFLKTKPLERFVLIMTFISLVVVKKLPITIYFTQTVISFKELHFPYQFPKQLWCQYSDFNLILIFTKVVLKCS